MRFSLKNLSLKIKLMSFAGFLLALMILGFGYAIYSMNSIGKELAAIAEEDIPLTEKLAAISTHQLEQGIQFERALHYGAILELEDEARGRFDQAVEAFDKGTEQVETEIREAEALAEQAAGHLTGEQAAEFRTVAESLKRIEAQHVVFAEHVHKVFAAYLEGYSHQAEELAADVEHEEENLSNELGGLLAEIGKFTEESAKAAAAHEVAAIIIIGILAVISIIVGLVSSWFFAEAIVKGVRKATATASGDLTQKIVVDSGDEIGELLSAMNGMRRKLLDMIAHMSDITAQLSTASEEMSTVTRTTSEALRDQRSETEMVATAIHEMSATAQEVAANIAHTATAASEANEQTRGGSRIVEQSIEQINHLAEQITTSAEAISTVEQYSEAINTVLDVIKSVAEQTNLLALNAAIEAARAGEQGRGFTVVADEVRTLAGRTQQSTEEINETIGKLQAASHQAVNTMEQSRKETQSAVENATKMGDALASIAQAVSKIDEMATQIASASEEQGAVSEEINRNITKINEMSAQTASGAEDTATASGDLSRMAADLSTIIGEFKVEGATEQAGA
jgi:methyl-accepting chemotaxis protein